MSTGIEKVEVDFLLLADHAEALNGKLYMMGGAWDRLQISDIAAPVSLSIVIGVLVPWGLTNEPHQLQVRMEDEDGNRVLPDTEITINMGRPATAMQGQVFRAIAALNTRVALPGVGAYRLIASVAGHSQKRATFYVVDAGQGGGLPLSLP